jgi:hypothetical protein
MSKEKQTAEEILKSKLNTTNWNFLHHVLHSGEVYRQILISHEEYANQQTSEMQKEIDELKQQYTKYFEEHQGNIKNLEGLYKETIAENIKLKQSADELIKSMGSFPSISETIAIENYKKLI